MNIGTTEARSSVWAPAVREIPMTKATTRELVSLGRERGLGLSPTELVAVQRYFRRKRREPTDVELAGLSQSWSEHCSYKSSRPLLRRAFSRLRPPSRVLGTGDAGVMAFGAKDAYALRIESHNHPSAIEPYGGAATGIGGILRDVLAVGARPVALADPLFFGPLDTPGSSVPPGGKSPRYYFDGVVAGIRDYGNRVGVPTVSGSICFDPSYLVNPLVNVACVGLLPRRRLIPNRAGSAGDRLLLVGGLTGRDGIGGVAFASRELTERSEDESRGAVQLGNPIMEEPLIRGCLEAADRGLIRGLKDLGGGGLATASGELVHAAALGSHIRLDRVPLREPGLEPWEIWISESQERMLLSVRAKSVSAVERIFSDHDVPVREIGEVVRGGVERIDYDGLPAADLELSFRLNPPPPLRARRQRPVPRATVPVPEAPDGLFGELVTDPDSVSREPVLRLYDHEVQGRTVVNPLQGRVESPSHGDAAVLWPRSDGWRGIAVATASSPSLCRESPREGARLIVEEAARNLYAVGARPDSLTNCLNFGNPEEPLVMGDFESVTLGIAESARALGFAIPSGNVSFYNGGLGSSIPPTPVLLGVGILSDIRNAVTTDAKRPGDSLYLIGRSSATLGGSLWARRRGLSGLAVPPSHPEETKFVGEKLLRAGTERLVAACHDVSDGGLAVALAEMSFGGDLGFDVDLSVTKLATPSLALAAEGASRWLVEVEEKNEPAFQRLFRGAPLQRLGEFTPMQGVLRWGGREVARIDLTSLYSRWRTGLSLKADSAS